MLLSYEYSLENVTTDFPCEAFRMSEDHLTTPHKCTRTSVLSVLSRFEGYLQLSHSSQSRVFVRRL